MPSRRLLVSLAMVSAAALGYEILLMRLFSIIQWQHFAYMMISLALLGFGASGSFLALGQRFLAGHFELAFAANALLFGLACLPCFLTTQAVPFNPLEILLSPRQWGYLAAVYLLLVPPFFFAGNCAGLALQRFSPAVGRVYAADLFGAGLGALGVILLLSWVFPLTALGLISGLGLAAAVLAWPDLERRPGFQTALLAAIPPLLWLAAGLTPVELKPVEYKGLAQALRVAGAAKLEERSSALGLLTVVTSPAIPFRHAPGLSLDSPAEVPEQLAVFTDGEGMGVINRYRGDLRELAFLDYLPSALPYHLLPTRPQVLILGADGGSEVLQALYHRASPIDAVDLNPQMLQLIRRDYADFAGGIYSLPQVRLHEAEARGYVASAKQRFDLIELALFDAFNASSAGLYALNESYVYTVEALQDYLAHLNPAGYLAITRWVRLPPRDDAKLFATAVEALERRGVSQPGERLAWIRGWQTSTLLVKNGDLSGQDIQALRAFCAARSFDLVWHPGIKPEETNVHNLTRKPYFYQAAIALLGGERQSFIERNKFDIRPATDDRPYFFLFFRWGLLPELLARRGLGSLSMLDMGYLTLVATLAQAVLASVLLILLPLKALRRAGRPQAGRWAGFYFFAIGLAFMFMEIVYIQKFTLYLAHPLYAVSVVLAGFLLFAGAGSRYAARFAPGDAAGRVVWAAAAIALLSALYLVLLPLLFAATLGLPAPLRIAAVLGLIAPLAFFMGMPFPLGLARLGVEAPERVPWVWGVNGCASVVAAVMATLLSIHLGQTAVLLLALALYALAAWTLGKRRPPALPAP